MHVLLVVNVKGIDIMYLCRMLIYFILILLLVPHVGTDVMVLRLFKFLIYFLFILHSGMEYRTLPQICGRLYLPIFLFSV